MNWIDFFWMTPAMPTFPAWLVGCVGSFAPTCGQQLCSLLRNSAWRVLSPDTFQVARWRAFWGCGWLLGLLSKFLCLAWRIGRSNSSSSRVGYHGWVSNMELSVTLCTSLSWSSGGTYLSERMVERHNPSALTSSSAVHRSLLQRVGSPAHVFL